MPGTLIAQISMEPVGGSGSYIMLSFDSLTTPKDVLTFTDTVLIPLVPNLSVQLISGYNGSGVVGHGANAVQDMLSFIKEHSRASPSIDEKSKERLT